VGFAREGDAVALVGPFEPSRRGSEVAKLSGEPVAGPLPAVDVASVREAHANVRDAVRSGRLSSAHDIAEGGLAVALAECCLAGRLGARVEVPEGLDVFGEAPGTGFVVSGPAEALEGFEIICPVPAAVMDHASAEEGWKSFRTELVRYLSLPFYQKEFRNGGYSEDVDTFLRDREQREPQAAVPQRLAMTLGAVGPGSEVKAMIERYRGCGVTLPLLRPVHPPAVEATLHEAKP